MPALLSDEIIGFAAGLPPLAPTMREQVADAFVDTFAAIIAGWTEPVTQALSSVYRGIAPPGEWTTAPADPEQAALIWGTAAHALDFDDVHMTAVTHPSAVLVPALVAAASHDLPKGRVAEAYAVGLATNVALGEALGFGHYSKGWHATSTIGPIAAAAAVAHLWALEEKAFRSSLSIAVSQAAGTQVNFGSMAKPLQAGLAAAAGLRGARLAAAGVEAAPDAFGEKGFLDLYGGGAGGRPPLAELNLIATPESLSRKLYPCCYMAHRPIAAALTLSARLDPAVLADEQVRFEVHTPYGCTKALRVAVPQSGLEAKFSGPYCVAAALLDRKVTLASFETAAVQRPAVQDLLLRVTMSEDPLDGALPNGIDHGTVRIIVRRGLEVLDRAETVHYPGSPAQPAGRAEIARKAADCLAHHHARGGGTLDPTAFIAAARAQAGEQPSLGRAAQ